jgi:hypothetical protein
MKKWFKDTDTREGQLMPVELRGHSDGRRGAQVTDKESYYVIMWHGRNDEGWSYQVGFSCLENYSNNYWHIFLFDNNDECIVITQKESLTKIPPVWNREWGGIDYYDYLDIMALINRGQKHNNLQEFPVNTDRKGKFLHFVKGDPEKILEGIKTGQPYEILAIRAEMENNGIQRVK